MSRLLDRLNFFARKETGRFADGHGVTAQENRDWEKLLNAPAAQQDRAFYNRGKLHRGPL